jgi:hypothetical protein
MNRQACPEPPRLPRRKAPRNDIGGVGNAKNAKEFGFNTKAQRHEGDQRAKEQAWRGVQSARCKMQTETEHFDFCDMQSAIRLPCFLTLCLGRKNPRRNLNRFANA